MKKKQQQQQTNKQTSRTVFVTYAEWNSCGESVISNEIEIGEHSGVMMIKNVTRGNTKKINNLKNFK